MLQLMLNSRNKEGETPFLALLGHRHLSKCCARGRAGGRAGWMEKQYHL